MFPQVVYLAGRSTLSPYTFSLFPLASSIFVSGLKFAAALKCRRALGRVVFRFFDTRIRSRRKFQSASPP